jgi:hypothetical protein
MRNGIALLLLASLSACSVTPDLKDSREIPEADRATAMRMAQLVSTRCRYERSLVRDGYRPPVVTKFTELPHIRRLYTSSSGWYKAEAIADGVQGMAYYQQASGRFVCGEGMWDKLPFSSTVTFSEVRPR